MYYIYYLSIKKARSALYFARARLYNKRDKKFGGGFGDGCVIGAGSVVTRDIPANSLAAGNPCRVIRTLTENDKVKNLR